MRGEEMRTKKIQWVEIEGSFMMSCDGPQYNEMRSCILT